MPLGLVKTEPNLVWIFKEFSMRLFITQVYKNGSPGEKVRGWIPSRLSLSFEIFSPFSFPFFFFFTFYSFSLIHFFFLSFFLTFYLTQV